MFLEFLQSLTGIELSLIPDPYFWGGGLHEIKKGGFLKIHADFNIHPRLKLNRRINLLIYRGKIFFCRTQFRIAITLFLVSHSCFLLPDYYCEADHSK